MALVVGVLWHSRGHRRTCIFSSFSPSPKIPLTIMKIIARYGSPLLLFTACVASWLLSSIYTEQYQASVGPDFLTRLPTKVINLAVALLLTRYLVGFVFPTIGKFTTTSGGKRESQFAYAWKNDQTDPRLWISVLVYLGSLFVLSQLLLG